MTLIILNGRTPTVKTIAFYKEQVLAVEYKRVGDELGKVEITIYMKHAVRLSSIVDEDALNGIMSSLGS